MFIQTAVVVFISIHALREEGDSCIVRPVCLS